MKRALPADCLPCGCISGNMLSTFASVCFRDWGKYGESQYVGLKNCITHANDERKTQVFMGTNGSAGLVVFRGYSQFHYVVDDVSNIMIPFEMVNSGALVNAIILNSYKDLRDLVIGYIKKHQLRTVYVIGHSMGAAMATLATVDIVMNAKVSASCFTFGSPKVGDSWFKKIYVNNVECTKRYVMSSDPIPLWPCNKKYVHVCKPVVLGSIYDRTSLWYGMLKYWIMKMFRMTKSDQKHHIVTDCSGVEGHELYSYAFSVRKSPNNLI